MSADNFDKHFREKLFNHESSIDGSSVWNGVEAGLSGRRKPMFFWWKAGALFLLIGTGAVYFGLSPKAEEPKAVATAEPPFGVTDTDRKSNASTPTEREKPSSPSEINRVKKNLPLEADATVPRPPSDGTDRPQVAVSERITPGGQTTSGHEDMPFENHRDRTETERKEDSFAHLNAAPPRSYRNKGEGGETRANQPNPMAGENTSPQIGASADEQHYADRAAKTVYRSVTHTTAAKLNSAENRRSTGGERRSAVGKEADYMLPLSASGLTTQAGLPILKSERTPNSTDPNLYGAHRKFFVQLSAGSGLLRREIISHHDDFRDLTRTRNTTERPLEYFDAHLTLGMRYENGFFWRSGISITQFNEHFSLNRTRTRTSEGPEVLSNVHVNAGGDSVYTYTQTNETTIITEQISHYNSYKLVDVPVFTGYDRDFGAWSFGAEAGILLNVLMEARGSMLGPTDEVIRLEDSGMFRERVQWSAALNLRINRKLSDRLQLLLSPGVRILPESVMAISEMEQRYVLFGGTFGVVYAF